MTSPAPRPETIEKLANGVYPAFAMLAGMQLDLFTPLKDGPMYAAQLAETLGVGSAKLQPLLYALVVAGLLTVDGERFANTPEANSFLVRGSPTYLGGMQGNFARQWHGTLKTAVSIQTGTAQDKIDFSAMSSEAGEAFFRQLHAGALTTGRELVARYDFSSSRTLLDVGGGSGGLAIALTEACPHLQATVVDLPTVTPITQRFVAEAGAAARVQVLAADVVQGPLTGCMMWRSCGHSFRCLRRSRRAAPCGTSATSSRQVEPSISSAMPFWTIRGRRPWPQWLSVYTC
jgi:hypothetical protein